MDISCAFPTTLSTPAHVKIAEDLGYRRHHRTCYEPMGDNIPRELERFIAACR